MPATRMTALASSSTQSGEIASHFASHAAAPVADDGSGICGAPPDTTASKWWSRDISDLPDDTNWTGAEIESCCRLASLLDVPLVQAAQNVVPVAVTAGDKIEGLRQWASGRCLSANRAGVYSRLEEVSGGRVRRVVRAE